MGTRMSELTDQNGKNSAVAELKLGSFSGRAEAHITPAALIAAGFLVTGTLLSMPQLSMLQKGADNGL